MGYQTLIAQQVQKAIDLLGDLSGYGEYKVIRTGTFDATSDTMSDGAGSKTISNVKMIKCSLSKKEMEASILTLASCKFLIPALNIPGVIPESNDLITFEGEIWETVDVKSPPSNPLWIIYAKRK